MSKGRPKRDVFLLFTYGAIPEQQWQRRVSELVSCSLVTGPCSVESGRAGG